MPRQRRQPRRNQRGEVPVLEETSPDSVETCKPKNVKKGKIPENSNIENCPGPGVKARKRRNRQPEQQSPSDYTDEEPVGPFLDIILACVIYVWDFLFRQNNKHFFQETVLVYPTNNKIKKIKEPKKQGVEENTRKEVLSNVEEVMVSDCAENLEPIIEVETSNERNKNDSGTKAETQQVRSKPPNRRRPREMIVERVNPFLELLLYCTAFIWYILCALFSGYNAHEDSTLPGFDVKEEEEEEREDPKQRARDYLDTKNIMLFFVFTVAHVYICKWNFHEIYFIKSIIVGVLCAHCRVLARSERSDQTYKSYTSYILKAIHFFSIGVDYAYIVELQELEEKGLSISTVSTDCLTTKLIVMHFVAIVGTFAGEHEKFLKKYEYVVGAASGLCGLALAEVSIKLISVYDHFSELVQQHSTNRTSIIL